MDFITSASTDIGSRKKVNQDKYLVRRLDTSYGRMCFAIICDGMGGYSEGEVASENAVNAFGNWADHTLPSLIYGGSLDDCIIREQWSNIIENQNRMTRLYGINRNITLGTTVTAILITEKRWFCINVGDSRTYEISNGIRQLTRDHSVAWRRNALTQCVGISENVKPDITFGATKRNAVYMLCSDGFRNNISSTEIAAAYNAAEMNDSGSLKHGEEYLIGLNKRRGESDNITVVSIKTVG